MASIQGANELIVRNTELRSVGDGTINGTVVTYGERTSVYGGLFDEVFEQNSLGDIRQADVILNVMHDRKRPLARTGGGGLNLYQEGPKVKLRAKPEDTQEARDAYRLVKAGVYRGLSMEFRAKKERFEGNLRRISEAKLVDVGVVDRPAYSGSNVEARYLEMRQADDVLSGFIPYGVPILVSMSRNYWIYLEARALTESLGEDAEVYLLAGLSYDNTMAGSKQGSLTLEESDEGINFRASLVADTTAVRDFKARLEANLVSSVVPGLAQAQTESVFKVIEDRPVEVVRKGALCELRAVTRNDFSDSTINRGRRRRRMQWPLL